MRSFAIRDGSKRGSINQIRRTRARQKVRELRELVAYPTSHMVVYDTRRETAKEKARKKKIVGLGRFK